MKASVFFSFRIVRRTLFVLTGALPLAARAANLQVTLTPADTVAADAAYPGSGSTISTRTDNQTGITVTVAGRNYGVNPGADAARWGIRAGALPWRENQQGFVLTNGFAPTAPGSTTATGGTGASYITIGLKNVPANTLFQNLSVEFDGMAFLGAANAWAASSVTNFTNWTVASLQNNGRRLVATIPEFTWAPTEPGPLEIRVYGLTGADEGALASLKVTASVIAAPHAPEPGVSLLAGLALAGLGSRRKRRRC